jgi:hypothetical protein
MLNKLQIALISVTVLAAYAILTSDAVAPQGRVMLSVLVLLLAALVERITRRLISK